MTPERAISILLEHKKPHLFTETKFAINVACKALEKRIPKEIKVKVKENSWTGIEIHGFVCPSCEKPIINVWNRAYYQPNYCHYCGQAFDWSEVDE